MAKIRRYDEIMKTAIANMAAKQDKITDFNEGSVIHTILDTVSRLAERAYVAIRQGYNEVLNLLPYSPFKFQKKSGMCASGSVVFQREAALAKMTRIPKGTKVSQGGVLVFTTIEDGVIFSGATESRGRLLLDAKDLIVRGPLRVCLSPNSRKKKFYSAVIASFRGVQTLQRVFDRKLGRTAGAVNDFERNKGSPQEYLR